VQDIPLPPDPLPSPLVEVLCKPLNPHADPGRYEAHQRRVLDSTGSRYEIRRLEQPKGPPHFVIGMTLTAMVQWAQRSDSYSHSYEPS
jgi:hypothetical protein